MLWIPRQTNYSETCFCLEITTISATLPQFIKQFNSVNFGGKKIKVCIFMYKLLDLIYIYNNFSGFYFQKAFQDVVQPDFFSN